MTRTVNGYEISPIWGWRHGAYLISTDSFGTAETGVGYFTVARGDWGTADPSAVTMTHVATALSLPDAVMIANHDARERKGL